MAAVTIEWLLLSIGAVAGAFGGFSGTRTLKVTSAQCGSSASSLTAVTDTDSEMFSEYSMFRAYHETESVKHSEAASQTAEALFESARSFWG